MGRDSFAKPAGPGKGYQLSIGVEQSIGLTDKIRFVDKNSGISCIDQTDETVFDA